MVYDSNNLYPVRESHEKTMYERFLEGEFADCGKHYAYDAIDAAEDTLGGMGQSMDIDPEAEREKFFQYPAFVSAISEHFDFTDKDTRKRLHNLDEAGQETVLTNLTSKLYDNIVKKAKDIDYGDIPDTKGDVTKLDNYDDLKETIGLLRDIVREYKQDTAPIDVLAEALSNIETRKTLFTRAYQYDIELPVLMYNTIVLGIITGTSYMIATCIEFIKSPKDETFQTVLDTMAYKKSKEHLVYNTLTRFNKSCASGEMDKTMDFLVNERAKKFTGAVAVAVTAGAIVVIGLILNIIPIMRELIFFFYYTRTSIADFFDMQADLLQMNAYNLQHNEHKDPKEREEIAAKQIQVADSFRSVAKKVAVDGKTAESRAIQDNKTEDKKMKMSDLDSEESISSLF